jgi:hypothetical protein
LFPFCVCRNIVLSGKAGYAIPENFAAHEVFLTTDLDQALGLEPCYRRTIACFLERDAI